MHKLSSCKKKKDTRMIRNYYRTSDVVMSRNYLDIFTYAFL
jgi:hypothetical protein